MSLRSSTDILLPEAVGASPAPIKLAAFVPIALALFGVSAILFGGLSARGTQPAGNRVEVDPIVTGSIAAPDARLRAAEMLDR